MVLPQNTLLAVLAVLASNPGGLATVLPRIPVHNDINGDPARSAKSWDPQGAHGLANPKVAEGIRSSYERTACATIIHGVCQPLPDKPVPEEPARPTLTKPKPVSGGGHAKCGAARKKESPILKLRDLNYLPPRPPPDWYKTKSWVAKSPRPQSTPEPETKETAQPPAEGVPAEDDSQKDAPTSVIKKIPIQHREFYKHPQPPASYLFVENLQIGLDPSKEVQPPADSPAGHLLNAGLRFWNLNLEAPRMDYLACFQVDYENPENANRLLCRKATKDLKILRDEKARPWAFLYENTPDHLVVLPPYLKHNDQEPKRGLTGRLEAIPIPRWRNGHRVPSGWRGLRQWGKPKGKPEDGKASEPKANEPVLTPEPKKAEAPVESPETKRVKTPVKSPKTEQPKESNQSAEKIPEETNPADGQTTY